MSRVGEDKTTVLIDPYGSDGSKAPGLLEEPEVSVKSSGKSSLNEAGGASAKSGDLRDVVDDTRTPQPPAGPDVRKKGPVAQSSTVDVPKGVFAVGTPPQPGREVIGTVVEVHGKLFLSAAFATDDPKPLYPLRDASGIAVGTFVSTTLERSGAELVARMKGDALAKAGTPQADVWQIAARHGLDPTFSPEVMAEVAHWQQNPGLDDPALVDMTDKAFITIDNESSKDLDQAMYIEKNDQGGYDVYYALADPSYYMRNPTTGKFDSHLFNEAMQRAATYYLPGFSVPMLPRELSEDLVSLNEGKDRRSLVFKMSMNADGQQVETTVSRAKIRSRKKLSYDGVQAMHDHIRARANGEATGEHPLESVAKDLGFLDTLNLLEDVGVVRMNDQNERDVVRYQRTPVHVGIEGTDDKAMFVLDADTRNEVEKWNEQISLLNNVQGAMQLMGAAGANLDDPDLQAIFRAHDRPPQRKLENFERFIDDMVSSQNLDPALWRWQRNEGQSIADYLEQLPSREDDPELGRLSMAINRQAMMTNVASEFQSAPGFHHGIGALAYARFSSPMREMVGCWVHKELFELMFGETGGPKDAEYRERVIAAANAAKKLQKKITKECNKLAIDALFRPELEHKTDERTVRRGTVMGVSKTKLYVLLDDPPIEVKVYLKDLERETGKKLECDDAGLCLKRDDGDQFDVGRAIDLRVLGYDEDAGRWSFEPVVVPAKV